MKTNEMLLKEIQAGKYDTSHVLHLLLSLLSAGIWIPVWFLVAQRNASKRASIINETGTFSKVFMILIAVVAALIIFGIVL